MKGLLGFALLALFAARADADLLYQQPPNPAGGSFVSSWWDPDGSNYDRYAWDAFTLGTAAAIHTVEWRGTFGATGAPTNFTVAIYASIPAGTQPDVGQPPLVEYEAGDNAGQTYAGDFGGVAMYDYAYTLPADFAAQAGVKYWLLIEGWQPGFPDWSLALGTGGDGSHFLCEHNNLIARDDPPAAGGVSPAAGVPTGCWFTSRTGDAAITLRSAGATGVDGAPGATGLVIGAVFPNPSRGDRLDVSFRLAGDAPAQLALHDVAGRRIAATEVGALGAGWHVVDLARSGPIPPGVYFVRLGRDASTRIAVVR